MNQVLLSIICPLEHEVVPRAEAAIDALETFVHGVVEPPDLAELDTASGEGTHFLSLHAVHSKSSEKAYLFLEVSADGDPRAALVRIVQALGDPLRTVFALASDWSDGGDLVDYLHHHHVPIGGSWSVQPGIGFVGAPGLTVGQIHDEARLSARIADLLEEPDIAELHGALERLDAVRRQLAADPPEHSLLPAEAAEPWTKSTIPAVVLRSLPSLLSSLFSPLAWIAALVMAVALGLSVARVVGHWPDLEPSEIGREILHLLKVALRVLFWSVVALVALGLLIYFRLRAAERSDWTDERAPDHSVNGAMFERESRFRQNHMLSITVRKPGLLRAFTLRLVFWFLGRAVGTVSPPGFLGTIGSIHFARWVTPPGTRDLLFASNYDGSWESYLEDFITRANQGLTGVWSNTVGFPRAANLVQGGASDSERFKRFARRSMIPTRFWYSAYPQLTMAAIRANRDIRRGLTGAMTEDEAAQWLALFGSAARPPSKIVSSGAQSLLFGGLGFMQHSRCLVIESLPDNVARARALLRTLRDDIAYDDGRRLRRPAVVILGLGPRALRRLGLPQESVGTFPFAFVEGMTGPGRRTILGDDPDQWRWGGRGADAIVLVYAEDGLRLGLKCGAIRTAARKHGASAPHVIALEPLGENKREPFGFVDGISQPVIRGTYKGLRNADPIHLVEPGEFILGYPDSRGNLPPGPTLNALHDPDNLLPLVSPRGGFDRNQVESPRDVGFNGSFLAVRELEQDVHGFWRYCEAEAKRLKDHDLLPQPYVIDSDFIGAKLVGRWRDGSSLARFPYLSQTDARNRVRSHATQRAPLDPGQGLAPIGSPPPQHDSDGDNDFLFGAEDPEGLRCPYGAHVRRSNPRDSLAPGTADEIAITNRHRIIRCGRSLAAIGGRSPGILFMCLNGDLERQFEFVQQTWLRNPAFHGLTCEKDPLLGDGEEGACSFTVPTRQGPIRLKPMPAVTTLRGGGYFFLPGKRLINYLCAEHGA